MARAFGPAGRAAAGAAVVGRVVRVVQAVRAVAEQDHQPGEPGGQADVAEQPLADVGHLVDGEADVAVLGAGRRARSARAAAGSSAGSGRSGRTPGGSARSAAGRGCGRPAGPTASTPTAAGQQGPEGEGPAADVELVRGRPQRPPRPRPAAVGLARLVADLLGRPSAAAGSRPGRAGRSGRRPPRGSTWPRCRSPPRRTSRRRGPAPPGGGGTTPRARRGSRRPGTAATPAGRPASGACRAMASSVWRAEPLLVGQVEDPPPLQRRRTPRSPRRASPTPPCPAGRGRRATGRGPGRAGRRGRPAARRSAASARSSRAAGRVAQAARAGPSIAQRLAGRVRQARSGRAAAGPPGTRPGSPPGSGGPTRSPRSSTCRTMPAPAAQGEQRRREERLPLRLGDARGGRATRGSTPAGRPARPPGGPARRPARAASGPAARPAGGRARRRRGRTPRRGGAAASGRSPWSRNAAQNRISRSLTSASVSAPVASSSRSRCRTGGGGGGVNGGRSRTPSQQTRQRAWSVNPSQSSSLQFSIVDSPNRSSSSARLAGIAGRAGRRAGRIRRRVVARRGGRASPSAASRRSAGRGPPTDASRPDPPQGVGLGDEPDQLLGRPGPERVLEHRQPQVEPRAEAGDRLAGPVAQVSLEHLLELGEPDPAPRPAPRGSGPRTGRAGSRRPAAPFLTASWNGRSSKACSVLWWMKTVIGPWAGR